MSKNCKCIWSVARIQYINWMMNPRIIIVGIFYLVMKPLVVDALLERDEKFGESLNCVEPFIAIGNSGLLVMLMPCVFFVLISDYPHMTGNTLFFMQRTQKTNWYFGQLLFVIMATFSFIMSTLLVSMIMSRGKFSSGWSNVVTKYEVRFPKEAGNFTSQYLPSNLYNQMHIKNALFHTVLLLALYLLLLALIIYFFKLIHIQSFGMLVAMFVVAAGVITTSLRINIMWAFPTANTILWLHFDEILSISKYPIVYSYLYFAILNSIMIIVNYYMVKKLELVNIELVD